MKGTTFRFRARRSWLSSASLRPISAQLHIPIGTNSASGHRRSLAITTDAYSPPANTQATAKHALPLQPPSARPVDTRKSQLVRTYTSLLRTNPLILLFQHNNLTAVEWAAVRRELKKATLAASLKSDTIAVKPDDIAPNVQLQVLRTNMFSVALKIVEFQRAGRTGPNGLTQQVSESAINHDLSKTSFESITKAAVASGSAYAEIESLMVGPLAALTIPTVSSSYLAAALSVLSPTPGMFPAPLRRTSPGYHEPACQNGLAKLLLVGGYVDGSVFDQGGIQFIGRIEGGLDGLRSQIIAILQGAGLGLTNALLASSSNLLLAVKSISH